MPIHDGHQIQKALAHGDVSDVSAPHLVYFVNLQVPQQIGVDLVLWVRPCGLGPWIERTDAHDSHQPLHPLSIDL